MYAPEQRGITEPLFWKLNNEEDIREHTFETFNEKARRIIRDCVDWHSIEWLQWLH
jgi:hypothetical protein